MSTNMTNTDFTISLANQPDTTTIVAFSARVQAALTASPTRDLQVIGPLSHGMVQAAVNEQRCFVVVDTSQTIVGCAFFRPLAEDYFERNTAFNITRFSRPWHYVHSVMLDPAVQGRGIGLLFVVDVLEHLERLGGTALLDCWAGNDKLKQFYKRCGFHYAATVPKGEFEVVVYVREFETDEGGGKKGS